MHLFLSFGTEIITRKDLQTNFSWNIHSTTLVGNDFDVLTSDTGFLNLTQLGVICEEAASVKELPPLD